MISYHLDMYWTLFIVLWIIMFFLRVWANAKIYDYAIDNLTNPKPIPGFLRIFKFIFTLYNRASPGDPHSIRNLKYRSNLLHLFSIYSVMFSVLVSVIAVVYDEFHSNEYRSEQPYRLKETNIIENPETEFGVNYNTTRKEKGLIPIPDNFRMSGNSTSRSEVWVHADPTGLKYYHEIKYVYLRNGEWNGEYDIFVFKNRDGAHQTLNADARMVGDSLVTEYRKDATVITEPEFREAIKEWGLEEEL